MIDRFTGCPLDKICEPSPDRFYRKLEGIKSCSNYFSCKVVSAAWKLPIQRQYDRHGQYWKVDLTPIVCEWRSDYQRYSRENKHPHCSVRFFSKTHIDIGYWLDRYLPCPTASDLIARERLSVDEIIAMEIRQAYQRAGFLEAISLATKAGLQQV